MKCLLKTVNTDKNYTFCVLLCLVAFRLRFYQKHCHTRRLADGMEEFAKAAIWKTQKSMVSGSAAPLFFLALLDSKFNYKYKKLYILEYIVNTKQRKTIINQQMYQNIIYITKSKNKQIKIRNKSATLKKYLRPRPGTTLTRCLWRVLCFKRHVLDHKDTDGTGGKLFVFFFEWLMEWKKNENRYHFLKLEVKNSMFFVFSVFFLHFVSVDFLSRRCLGTKEVPKLGLASWTVVFSTIFRFRFVFVSLGFPSVVFSFWILDLFEDVFSFLFLFFFLTCLFF